MYLVQQKTFQVCDIDHPIFDSLKADYPAFSSWFEKKNKEPIYVVDHNEDLAAILYLKIEQEVDDAITPPMARKKRLKVGTFKVGQEGIGIGKHLLQFVYEQAQQEQVEEIYVTVHEEKENHQKFIAFIERAGFRLHGYKNTERVYIKTRKTE